MSAVLTASLAAASSPATGAGARSSIWLLVLLPTVGAAVLLLTGRKLDKVGHLIATAVSGASFVLALVYFFAMLSKPASGRSVDVHLFSWIPVAGFNVDAGILSDQLSGIFTLLITGVGTLVHIYSIGYMDHDPNRRRFFAYLNLFLAAMLLLVLGDGYLLLYVGWEGVGLASYLLITFWGERPAAATAGKKAFVANRVGDVGLSIAIMIMFVQLGTTSFFGVLNGAGDLSKGALLAMCALLLLAGCGKSAQFPLHVWLPDAMEGPTPASSLIHAATMVTAGVYLIARSAPLFNLSQDARTLAAIVGVITILLGCVVGCAMDDIKKVLAYSTISQIGYMFLGVALGPGAYWAGLAHLLTHGFFKAGLFMGAGSVLHGMNDQVDMRRFGGLARVMPVTFVTMAFGWAAILGIPPFAGFFSKDKIIELAFDKGGTSGYVLGGCALLGAGITAFYMTRMMAMTFLGKKRWTTDVHPHESPATMTFPMIVLAAGSLFAGYVIVELLHLQRFLGQVQGLGGAEKEHVVDPTLLTLGTLVIVAVGAVLAYVPYATRPVPQVAPAAPSFPVLAARNKLGFDLLYEAVLMRPGQYLTRALVFADSKGLDGAVNGLAAGIGGTSGRLRRIQTGYVRSYALSIVGGTALVLGCLFVVRIG